MHKEGQNATTNYHGQKGSTTVFRTIPCLCRIDRYTQSVALETITDDTGRYADDSPDSCIARQSVLSLPAHQRQGGNGPPVPPRDCAASHHASPHPQILWWSMS